MGNLISLMLVKNEADKDLRMVIESASKWADQILVLDDNSTDGSYDLAKSLGCVVRRRHNRKSAWGNESPARAELWNWGATVVKDGWQIINDADQLLIGDPRPLTKSWVVNAWCFVLYDLWGTDVYREDPFWQAHWHPRPWMFCPSRVPEGWVATWPQRGIHCGHMPQNWPLVAGVVDPDVLRWYHGAYSDPVRRRAKFAQYHGQSHQMSDHERRHAASILDFDAPPSQTDPAG